MIRVEPYEPAHLRRLVVDGKQAHLLPVVEDDTYAVNIARGGPNWTAFDGDRPIAVAGFYSPWEGRAIAHAILASDCGRHLSAIIRQVRLGLLNNSYWRIEAHVKTDRPECHRFARLCGFTRLCTLRRFQAGADYDLYERVTPWPS